MLALRAGGTAALAMALVLSRPAPFAGKSLRLQPCEQPGIAGGGRCGTLDVFENRSARTGRQIGLHVVVIPAQGTAAALDPVFWLEGGPGAAATQAMGPVSQGYLHGLRPDHDLVFVDKRGTGKSNPLNCDDIGETPADLDAYFGKLFPIDRIRACRERLEQVALFPLAAGMSARRPGISPRSSRHRLRLTRRPNRRCSGPESSVRWSGDSRANADRSS